MKVLIKNGCTVKDKDYEEGKTYDVSDKIGKALIEQDYAIKQPELGEEEEDLEIEEGNEEGVPEDLQSYLSSRGFSKDPEKEVWSKTVNVGGKEVNLVRDFTKSDKGSKMAIEADSDKSRSDIAEEHPDQKYFTLLRNGEVSLEEAIAKAESEADKYGKKEEKSAGEIGEKLSISNEGGQGQKMKVQMEPAIKLDEEETTKMIESKMIEGLEIEDLEALIWDPEDQDVPYDRPTASAEAYDLFARIVEMALGVQYSAEDVQFRIDEEENVMECDVTIVRHSTDPRYDGKILKGYKTRSMNRTSGKDHWRERLYTKARRNALKSEIPKTWISRLLKRYKDITGQGLER